MSSSHIQPGDTISLTSFTRVGLGWAHEYALPKTRQQSCEARHRELTYPSSAKIWFTESPVSAVSLRTGMVVLGGVLLVCGASPALFQRGFAFCKRVDWKAVRIGIIRAAECSRWFYMVIQATRDLHRKWP